MKRFLFLFLIGVLIILPLQAQVLGPCGAPGDEGKTIEHHSSKAAATDLTVSPVPLPGQQALDFELTAVVGDDIKNIKLSDYDGKWRVVCFFPAAFTFV